MYRLKLIHSHPPRMRRLVTWWVTWCFIAFWPPTQIWLRLHSFFSETTHFCPFSTPLIFYPDLCRRILTYAREDNESSTWDSTRLQTVVFVMWSFWSFVSCPATQNAIRNNFAPVVCNQKFSKLPCNKMFPAISQQKSRYCHNRILIPEDSMDTISRRMKTQFF